MQSANGDQQAKHVGAKDPRIRARELGLTSGRFQYKAMSSKANEMF